MAVENRLQPAVRHRAPAAAWALTGVAIFAIWAAVVIASIYSPDFVSGSQQEHLTLVGWLDWVWGAVATGYVVVAAQRGIRSGVASLTPWVVMAVGVAIVWAGVAYVSVVAPVFVTGTDPTRIPMTALGIPILGTFLTWFVCALSRTAFEPDRA